jgi:hypothetical protein
MVMRGGLVMPELDFGMPVTGGPGRGGSSSPRTGLRLATPSGVLRGPEKYRLLDLKRRRAQIRARRALGLVD